MWEKFPHLLGHQNIDKGGVCCGTRCSVTRRKSKDKDR